MGMQSRGRTFSDCVVGAAILQRRGARCGGSYSERYLGELEKLGRCGVGQRVAGVVGSWEAAKSDGERVERRQ